MPKTMSKTRIVPKSSKICQVVTRENIEGRFIALRYVSREDGSEKTEYIEAPEEEYEIILTVQGATVQGHSKPSWVRVYKRNKDGEYIFDGNAVLKSANDGHSEYAQFPAPVHEALFSKLSQTILPESSSIRIPKIEVVQLEGEAEPKTLSFNVADDGAKLFLMEDVLFSAEEVIEEQRVSAQITLSMDEFLSRVRDFIRVNIKMQVQNQPFRDERETLKEKIERKTQEQYAIVEEEILTIVLIDSMLNNADRHGCNWALVLDKDNNWHVAIWDHETSMIGLACDKFSRPKSCWGDKWDGFSFLSFARDEKVELERRKNELEARGEVESEQDRRRRIFMLPLDGNQFLKYCRTKNSRLFEKFFAHFDSLKTIEAFKEDMDSIFPDNSAEYRDFISVISSKLDYVRDMRRVHPNKRQEGLSPVEMGGN